jgi:hypothetical protein
LNALRREGSVVEEQAAVRTLRGPLASNGDVHAGRGHDGRWFIANIGKRPAKYALGESRGRLAGGESRFVDAGAAAPTRRTRTLLVLPDRWNVVLPDENAVFLHDWTLNGRRIKELAPPFVLQPVAGAAMGETLFGPVPLQSELDPPRTWIYRTSFTLRGRPELDLVCESGHMRGDWTALLNGRPLAGWRKSSDFLLRHALGGALRVGSNRLEFHFTLRHSTDGMIGSCRLEGNLTTRRRHAVGPLPLGPVVATAKTTRAELGLPFFSGPLRFWQRFQMGPPAGKSLWLNCVGITGYGAAVRVNGQLCGSICWAPDEVEVTRAVRAGSNLLEIDWRGSPVTLTGREDHTQLGCRVKLVGR